MDGICSLIAFALRPSEITNNTLSDEFTIFRYTAPDWLTDQHKKATLDQAYTEVNKARAAFNLSEYSFTNTPIVIDFTWIKADDMAELVTASNEIAKKANKNAISNSAVKGEDIAETTLQRIQNLLDSLGE